MDEMKDKKSQESHFHRNICEKEKEGLWNKKRDKLGSQFRLNKIMAILIKIRVACLLEAFNIVDE